MEIDTDCDICGREFSYEEDDNFVACPNCGSLYEAYGGGIDDNGIDESHLIFISLGPQ